MLHCSKSIKTVDPYQCFLVFALPGELCGLFPRTSLSLTNREARAAALAGVLRRFRGGLPSSVSEPCRDPPSEESSERAVTILQMSSPYLVNHV